MPVFHTPVTLGLIVYPGTRWLAAAILQPYASVPPQAPVDNNDLRAQCVHHGGTQRPCLLGSRPEVLKTLVVHCLRNWTGMG